MSDKYNDVSNSGKPNNVDAEFYTVLGWLTALSVSIASWAGVA